MIKDEILFFRHFLDNIVSVEGQIINKINQLPTTITVGVKKSNDVLNIEIIYLFYTIKY